MIKKCAPYFLLLLAALGGYLFIFLKNPVPYGPLIEQAPFLYEHTSKFDTDMKIASMYLSGDGIPQDTQKGIAWQKRAADKGSLLAMSGLGMMYCTGKNVPRDPDQGLAWYKKYAATNDTAGLLTLIGTFYTKEPIAPECANAFDFYMANHSVLNDRTKGSIAKLYFEGGKIPENYEKALFWAKNSSSGLSYDSNNILGIMYRDGIIVPQDYKQAFDYFSKNSNSDIASQFYIGEMYLKGLHVEKDHTKALDSFIQAEKEAALRLSYKFESEIPYGKILNYIAWIYENGENFSQDKAKALEFYTRAANAGDAEAQNALARIYSEPEYEGVTPSPQQAYFWARLAQNNHYSDADKYIELNKPKLSEEQLAFIESRVLEWKVSAP